MENTLTVSEKHSELALPGVVSTTALELPEGMSYREWEKVGRTLNLIEGSVAWWYGDWVKYGEAQFGETHSQALDERNAKTLMNYVFVAKAVPVSRRRDTLSWSHHAEVAAKQPEQQVLLLDIAEQERLSVRDFRRRISGNKPAAVNRKNEDIAGSWEDHSAAERLYPTTVSFDITFQVRSSTMRKRGDKEYSREADWFVPLPRIEIKQDYAARVRDAESGNFAGLRELCEQLARKAFENPQLREAWVNLPSEKPEEDGYVIAD